MWSSNRHKNRYIRDQARAELCGLHVILFVFVWGRHLTWVGRAVIQHVKEGGRAKKAVGIGGIRLRYSQPGLYVIKRYMIHNYRPNITYVFNITLSFNVVVVLSSENCTWLVTQGYQTRARQQIGLLRCSGRLIVCIYALRWAPTLFCHGAGFW